MVQTPNYEVVRGLGKVELRKYPDLVLASSSVSISGNSDNRLFSNIADFIFGNNSKKENIPMTAPVISTVKGAEYKMSFIMPTNYSVMNLPKPISGKIEISKQKKRILAVLRFSGFVNEKKILKIEKELISELGENKIKTRGEPFLMRYNPPWTLPFMRRNELGIEIFYK